MIKKFSELSINESGEESDYWIHSENSNEFIDKNLVDYWHGGKAQYTKEDVSEALVEFAKIHVRNAVRKMTEIENDRVSDPKVIDEITDNNLKHCYPLENIK